MGNAYAHTYAQSPPPFTVDYSLAPGRAIPVPVSSPYAPSRTQTPSPYHHLHTHDTRGMDPTMVALLDTLRASGSPFHPGGVANTYHGPPGSVRPGGYHTHSHQGLDHHLAANRAAQLSGTDGGYNLATYDVSGVGVGAVQAHTQSGYTATEEFIMRAHAEGGNGSVGGNLNLNAGVSRRRALPPPLDLVRRRRDGESNVNVNAGAGIGLGMRGYRTQASAVAVARQQQQGLHAFSPDSMTESLPSMSEEFHASGAINHHQTQIGEGNRNLNLNANAHNITAGRGANSSTTLHKHNHRIHPAHVNARLSRDHQRQQNTHSPLLVQQPQTQAQAPSPNPNSTIIRQNYQYQPGVHMRSSTLPQHRSTSSVSAAANASRHYQHSSMSIPASNSSLNSAITSNNNNSRLNLGRPTGNNNNNDIMNKHITSANDAISIYDASDRQTEGINVNPLAMNPNNGNGIHYNSQKIQHHHSLSRGHPHYREHNPNIKHLTHTQNQNQNQNQTQNGYETDSQSASPALISPTLTYSSHTPSTLSPATPFFGSFQGAQEGFATQSANELTGVGVQRKGSQ
jgi:hypothetical protein